MQDQKTEHPRQPDLPVFALDYDQPTTCPQCGGRTDWVETPAGTQHHTCSHCGMEFIAEDDNDDFDYVPTGDDNDEEF